jgi:serine---pyruvate transaminase
MTYIADGRADCGMSLTDIGIATDSPIAREESWREQTLAAPGPTPIPPEVRAALARPILHHRAPQFHSALRRVRTGLQEIAHTENPVILLACTGTAAMESAVVNLCGPGDAVVVISAGYFGERWVRLTELYGYDVVPLRYEWGAVPSSDDLAQTLVMHPQTKAVFLVHSETSTGVVVDVEQFAAVAKAAGVMLVVDAVSSFAAVPIETDAWGIDVLISSSHKALMTPPGLAFVILSPAALEAAKSSPVPRYYLDWRPNLAPQESDEPETWFSPAVSLVVALDAALEIIRREGLERIHRRHVRLGQRCRSRVKALGLNLFSPDNDTAAVLTAVRMPDGVDSTGVVRAMHDDWAVTVADGEAMLKGKIIRVGHLGYVTDADVDRAVDALGAAVAATESTQGTSLRTSGRRAIRHSRRQ